MHIELRWHRPRGLKPGRRYNLIYHIDLDLIPEAPGIYMFSRRYGENASPLYIGQAKNLRARIKQQLNRTRLMMGMRNAPSGKRTLSWGVLQGKPGQSVERTLDIAEKALINSAVSEGHELLNVQGARPKFHLVQLTGSRSARAPFSTRVWIRRGRISK